MNALGIGLPYIDSLPARIYRPGLIDFVEVTPETLCRERRSGRLQLLPDKLKAAQDACANLPIVVHGVELSIGSAHGANNTYLQLLDEFQSIWPFSWHSEHLGFHTILGEDAHTLNVGVPLPMPPTEEAADLVAQRSQVIQHRYGVPFLLENAAYYLTDLPTDPSISDEVGLMNAILDRSPCMHLLDLHNVWCNAINHKHDAFSMIDRMRLDRVGELHIAGGSWDDGFYTDAHNNSVPKQVWTLLDYTLPLTPNAGGVVFEMLELHAANLSISAIEDDLFHAREVWNRHRLAQPADRN